MFCCDFEAELFEIFLVFIVSLGPRAYKKRRSRNEVLIDWVSQISLKESGYDSLNSLIKSTHLTEENQAQTNCVRQELCGTFLLAYLLYQILCFISYHKIAKSQNHKRNG